MKKILLLFMLLIVPSVMGASISGNVYDLDLHRVDSALVTINSVPLQKDVTENGAYEFEVAVGTYSIVAEQISNGVVVSSSVEDVVIDSEGKFVLDLVLLPTLNDNVETADSQIDVSFGESVPSVGKSVIVLIVLIISGIVIYFLLKDKKKIVELEHKIEDAVVEKLEHGIEKIETAEDAEEVLKFIKSQGGRVMQKDIRKNFPSSEAKISLIISELESDGKVRRIKKGRGNLILLK